MIYEPPERARPRRRRTLLDSPIVAGAIVLVVAGVVAGVLLVPGLLPFGIEPGRSQAAGGPTATPAGPTPAQTFARPTPSPAPTFRIYRVKPGDSLNSIARRFDTDGRSIAWWNRGFYPSLDPESPDYDPNTIRVGWEFVLLPNVQVDDENPPAPIGTPRETPRP